MMKKWLAPLVAFALVASALTAFSVAAAPDRAEAASGADFDAGNIISDKNFYDAQSMSLDSIQSFLNQQVPTCRATSGPTCLKNYSMDTTTRQDSGQRCGTYPGGPGQSAARIIYNVSQVCGISPKALLVLLEKEQGIVTSSAPTAYMYRSATGFGCPDTAACDAQYYGFFNQVYGAALQFKRYAATPTSWSYQAGRTNNVFYHPNAACGTKPVYIQNQATASLYIYTPYTPNAAALNNMYGTGDSCSAYGNRNFFRLYTDWFGSTTGGTNPYGYVDAATAGFQQVAISGWAVDPDSTGAIRVDFYIDGQGVTSATADIDYPHLAPTLGASNTRHGFSKVITGVAPGAHSICAIAINVMAGGNTLLECRSFTVASGAPFGYIDQVSASPATIAVRGWAIDPDVVDPVTVRLSIDGQEVVTARADVDKPSLPAVYPGWGSKHAFTLTATGIAPGAHSVCTTITNVGSGQDTRLGCSTVQIPSGSPQIYLDQASSTSPGVITLRGWALDPDTVDPVRVHVYLDGVLTTKLTADVEKASLATAFPGYGARHAFTASLTGVASGTRQVCVYAINQGPGENAGGCVNVVGPQGPPALYLDEVRATDLGQVLVRGWSVDPDTVDPVRVHVYVDGMLNTKFSADLAKESLSTAFPGYGAGHAFSTTLAGVGPGTHQICFYAINVGVGANTVACSSVRAVSGAPAILLDEASSPAVGTARLRGWTIDPDSVEALRVHVYVDGILTTKVTADVAKPSLATTYPPYGANHQFDVSVAGLRVGTHELCAFAINVGPGENRAACATVTVR